MARPLRVQFSQTACPGSSDAQKLGFAYVYGQDGTLLGEYGMGGSNSSGTTQYIYLPTANGPMPIAAIVNGVAYAVHSDHLNTPRKLTQPDGQVAWQWAYSAFGDEQPTLGAKRFTNETTNPTTGTTPIPEVTFNLRYPGQYFDKESYLHYNYFRSYSAERGRYTQADPIGLDGGFNRFGYVDGDALDFSDPFGLSKKKIFPYFDRSNNFNEAWLRANNCYSYVLGRSGRLSHRFGGGGGLDPGEISGEKFSQLTCENIFDAARRDGTVSTESDGFCPAGHHQAKLFIREGRYFDIGGDYHWHRQDSNGSWSDKPGGHAARNLGYSPLPPSNYPVQCGSICIKN